MVALKEVYGNKINFVLIKTIPRIDNEKLVPGLKVYHINSQKNPIGQVMKICRKHKIDILHTHNYPDTYGFWGIKARDKLKIPVVHECHDIGYHNTSPGNAQLSGIVMKGVDKIITVGPGMSSYLETKYKVGKKCHIVYAYPNRSLLPSIKNVVPTKYYNGVYQGGINPSVVKGSSYNHRYYGNIFKKLSDQGLNMEVYPAKPVKYHYNIKNVTFKKTIPSIKTLYHTLMDYSFGFVGYNPTPSTVMDIADPNKIYEYLSVGLPVLVMDYTRIADFVRANGFGIVIDKNTLKIPKEFHERMAVAKKNVLKRRGEHVMERQAMAIYKMYQGLLK